ncbi:MAG: hypothetical protein GDA48_28680 [Hormoscilla sp. GM102CHS1]|nr:hypothetical protein [Hormoscilla sp. GM102CHS1]
MATFPNTEMEIAALAESTILTANTVPVEQLQRPERIKISTASGAGHQISSRTSSDD